MCKFATVLQMKSSNVKNICSWVRAIQLWHRPCAERFPWRKEKGRVGQDIYKKAFTTLWFWLLEIWQFQNECQKTKQRECPVVCYIHALTMPYSHWCIRMPRSVGCVRRILTYRRGAFGVARFWHSGFARASRSGASNSIRASRLFCVWTKTNMLLRCL
jgi:hypothetical protein